MSDDWDAWDGGDFAEDDTGDWDSAPSPAAPAPAEDMWGGNDAGDEWGTVTAGDDWENEGDTQEEKKKEVKTQKKNLKQLAKDKEAQEKAEREKAAKAAEEEKKRMMQDPEYRLKMKEQEKKAIERSELDLISDFFGSANGPSSKEEMRKEANPDRARELAMATGLGDGADGNDDDFIPSNDVDMFAIPTGKSDKRAAPNPLDSIEFNADSDISKFVTILQRKIKDVGTKSTTNNSQTMSKVLLCELIRDLGPGMKSQDLDEVLRLATVEKNNLLKSQSSKNNPKKKAKKGIKTHDNGADFSDDNYDY